MLYIVRDAVNQDVIDAGPEAYALLVAVKNVAKNGRDLTIQASGDPKHVEVLWYVEADTKVEDTDPYYPVIVSIPGTEE